MVEQPTVNNCSFPPKGGLKNEVNCPDLIYQIEDPVIYFSGLETLLARSRKKGNQQPSSDVMPEKVQRLFF